MKTLPLFLLLALAPATTPAAVVADSGALNLLIPDDTNTGLTTALTIAEAVPVESVRVTLSLSVPAASSGWIGDLYAYVRHDSGLSVLLNRPGRNDGRIAGYADDQNLDLTFADGSANGDIHGYRTTLLGDESLSLSQPLVGLWEPDGRTTDPAQVRSGDARSAMLDGFSGMDASGTWHLFLADLSSGGEFQLNQWSLEINGSSAVPEPVSTALATTVVLGAWLGFRGARHRRR